MNFLASAPSVAISIEEVINRDEGAGPFIWVRPQDVSGIEAPAILARNLKSRATWGSDSDADDVLPETYVCSYLESCVRHRSDQSKIQADDVIAACVYMMVCWGTSLPAHGFYGDLDLLSLENASRILKSIRLVYDGLSHEVLRQNIRYFVSEHYRSGGAWLLGGESRFLNVMDSEDLGFLSSLNLEEMNSGPHTLNENFDM